MRRRKYFVCTDCKRLWLIKPSARASELKSRRRIKPRLRADILQGGEARRLWLVNVDGEWDERERGVFWMDEGIYEYAYETARRGRR